MQCHWDIRIVGTDIYAIMKTVSKKIVSCTVLPVFPLSIILGKSNMLSLDKSSIISSSRTSSFAPGNQHVEVLSPSSNTRNTYKYPRRLVLLLCPASARNEAWGCRPRSSTLSLLLRHQPENKGGRPQNTSAPVIVRAYVS